MDKEQIWNNGSATLIVIFSSSSASFSLFSFSRGGSRHDTRIVTDNFDVNSALRKSRSVAILFLISRSRWQIWSKQMLQHHRRFETNSICSAGGGDGESAGLELFSLALVREIG
ncbi:hypothetical protein L1987_60439 [Smallanthus sonchifolius]|uniref:Uncharacterized protein n=1 Tax=Smallanthus sonchifolius TaxID=185202 RepID=A0ACB9D8G5_9ASTR|nr:hypothetical protein L1987_60439 [Smallanthus sonchifolius]